MKVLLVEDEKKIADFVRAALKERGFLVDHCAEGDSGYAYASQDKYDVLVLDIMLPGRDGLSILKAIRKAGNTTPVLLLTARNELDDRVEGLSIGADDYLGKPFFVEELTARIQALIRRVSGERQNVLEAGDLRLDRITRVVNWRGEIVDLTSREFNLIEYLMRTPGRVFTRTEILEHVWGYDFDPSTNVVDVCIQRIRRKLASIGVAAGPESPIESVRGGRIQVPKTAMSVSFRLRLTLLSALLSGAVLIVFASAMWWQIYRMRVERITSDVRAYAERESGRRRDAADWQRTAGRIAIEMGVHDAGDLVLIIEDGEGTVLYQSPAWPVNLDAGRLPWPGINGTTAGFEPSLRAAPPPPPRPGPGAGDGSHPPREIGPAPRDGPPAPPPESVSVSQQADGRHWTIGLATTNASRVAVAVSENVIDADMKGIRRAILTAMPIALFITGVGAWMFSGRALRPVKELTDATRRVTAAGLDRRISPQDADREFVELITVFNGMLERLERSFKQAYRFSADAAHELKTPLAILQGQIERAIQSVDQDSAMQAELTSILDEVRRLSAISRKLLLLSQADAGRLNLHRTPFDLSQALSDLLEDTRMLAPHLQVTGEIQPGLVVPADGILLPQVLHNLISNAIKYNVDGGWIRISAGEGDDQVVVTIANSSIGISSVEQEKIFDRFYRSESARNKGLEGVGLGLSVSREIVRAHGGDIALQTQSNGDFRFSLLLPRPRGDKE